MLLVAKILKTNSSQFCTTPSCGVLWIKVTRPVIVAEPVSVDVVFRVEFITFLVTAAESVSVNVTFMVEFIAPPLIVLWT